LSEFLRDDSGRKRGGPRPWKLAIRETRGHYLGLLKIRLPRNARVEHPRPPPQLKSRSQHPLVSAEKGKPSSINQRSGERGNESERGWTGYPHTWIRCATVLEVRIKKYSSIEGLRSRRKAARKKKRAARLLIWLWGPRSKTSRSTVGGEKHPISQTNEASII